MLKYSPMRCTSPNVALPSQDPCETHEYPPAVTFRIAPSACSAAGLVFEVMAMVDALHVQGRSASHRKFQDLLQGMAKQWCFAE